MTNAKNIYSHEEELLVAKFMGYLEPSIHTENLAKTKFEHLMPILIKIESMGHKTIIGGGDPWGNYCNIMFRKPGQDSPHFGDDTKALGQGDTKIEAVYNAVIKFIEWFNKK